MKEENYYEILGVSVDAESEEIEKALHKQFREWSHRLNSPVLERRQQAEEMLEKLEIMEETLLNEGERKRYDQELKETQAKEATHLVEVKKLSRGRIPPASKSELSPPEKEVKKSIRLRRWMVGFIIVLFIGGLSFISWDQLTDKETPVQVKIDIQKPEDLIEEIKKYASQGKVYGVPFGIGATMEEVKKAWGEPESGKLVEEKDNYYPGKHISLEICEQKVCAITAVRKWREPKHFSYELPPRYKLLTFDRVKKVLGENYTVTEEYFKEHTYKLSDYELNFSVSYDDNIKILFFSVRKPSPSQTTPPPMEPEQEQTTLTEEKDLLSEIWQLGLQGDEQGIQSIVIQNIGDIHNITLEQVIEAWGDPTEEEKKTNGYMDVHYYNGTDTISITFNQDGKIYDIFLTKGMYSSELPENQTTTEESTQEQTTLTEEKDLLSEIWQLGLQGDEQGIQSIISQNGETLQNITMEQVIETWGEPTRELSHRNDYTDFYYYNGTDTMNIYFDQDGKVAGVSFLEGMDLGD